MPSLALRALPVAEALAHDASVAVQLAEARTARSYLVDLHALPLFLEVDEHSRPTKHSTMSVELLVSVGCPAVVTTLRSVATARLATSDPLVALGHKLPQSFPLLAAQASVWDQLEVVKVEARVSSKAVGPVAAVVQ